MVDYFIAHPLLAVVLAAAAAFTLWLCVKAGKASSKSRKANEEIMRKLDEENKLRNDFAILTPRLIDEAEPERLVKGIGINLFKSIENAGDLNAAFEALTAAQRDIYALYFVIDEGAEKLSRFFEANGQPLTGTANGVISKLFPGELSEIFTKEYLAFDGEDETTSFIPAEISSLDERFARVFASADIFGAAAKYIRENIGSFVVE